MTYRPVQSHDALSVAPDDGAQGVTRAVPEEVPVAMVFDGGTQAVMMASPQDLGDFAVGFALSEGVIDRVDQMRGPEIIAHDAGIEARMWLEGDRADALKSRRRAMLGPVGCGLCGIDSIEQALRDVPRLPDGAVPFATSEIASATDALRAHQPLHDQTHAVHAAGFLQPGQGITHAREDVGRHNALDKLIGALAQGGVDPATGAMVLTSRVSVDMVQKTVIAGCALLIAVSAPTAQALRLADHAGLCVAANARKGRFDTFTHPQRITIGEAHVA